MSSVIVFGPTGNVASVAARTAQENGAKVHLAMRDTSKTIPGLSPEEEKSGGFERVQADLTKPDTVTEAVKKTGAKRAFMYLAMGSPDHMKSTLSALKSAGVDFVVFLSSYTIDRDDLTSFSPKELIPFIHAQVELSLDEIYGPENYVAVRPGAFVTNLLRFKDGIVSGDVRIFGSAFKMDCITPGDMGRVSGTILAKGPQKGQRKVYVYGPQIISQRNALGVIGKVLGTEVKVTDIDEQEAREQFAKNGIPKPAADYLVGELAKVTDDTPSVRARYEEGVENVQLYTGRPSTGLEEWVKDNRDLFSA